MLIYASVRHNPYNNDSNLMMRTLGTLMFKLLLLLLTLNISIAPNMLLYCSLITENEISRQVCVVTLEYMRFG